MMRLGERLKVVRGGVSRREFAESVGVSPASIENWESERHSPPADVLGVICDKYDVSESWLISERGPMHRGSPGSGQMARAFDIGLADPSEPFRHVAESTGFFPVPVFRVVASSGHGAFQGSEELAEPMAFPLALLRRLASHGIESLAIVFNRGDSNEPDIYDGDAMLVDRGIERIADDAFYVFAFDDALMVKAIERLLDGRVALKARNPSYREEIISKEDATRLKVFGRVIWRGGLV